MTATTDLVLTTPAAQPRTLLLRVCVAAALVGPAVVHALVVREHLEEWLPAGAFFAALAAVQGVSAVWAAVRWDRAVAAVVVVVSLATVATWLVSRTAGLPFGPVEMQGPEPIGLLDAACCVAELVAAAVAIACWPTPERSSRFSSR